MATAAAIIWSAFINKSEPVKRNAFSSRALLRAEWKKPTLEEKIKEMYRMEYETCGPGGYSDVINAFFKAKEHGDEKSAKRLYEAVREMGQDRLQRQSDCEFMREMKNPFLKRSEK
jgi:hypothetical protein